MCEFNFNFDINIEYWGNRDMETHDLLDNRIICNEEQLNICCNVSFIYNNRIYFIFIDYHNCFDECGDVWNNIVISYDNDNKNKVEINDHLYLCHNKSLYPTYDIEKFLINEIKNKYNINNINILDVNICRSGIISLRKNNVEYNKIIIE